MSERAKLHIDVDAVELEVNDAGDIIKLPLSDELFMKKFYDFAKNIQAKATELDKVNEDNDIDISNKIDKDIEFHEFLKTEFNGLFGERSYEKVYGEDYLVGVEYVLQFIDACTPYIEKHTQKRLDKFSKYSADRQGSTL